MRSGLDYRADLDGLRAVAVVPVILFHLGFPYTPGGYVGVDVFFVLSGYLITRQIALELDQGHFSLLGFYDRRIRRLFPALFAMLFVSTIIALFVLLPRDLDGFGESLVAAVLSISNFYFWSERDYFAPAAETMPLLHTWSLSVEEQFYILFPALLLLAWPFGRAHVRHGLIALAALSFVASIWITRVAPDAAFYLLPTRAWELLIGSLLALSPAATPIPPRLRTVATSIGLAGIGAAVFTYHAGTRFPGFAAALPAVGCAVIIWAGQVPLTSSAAPRTPSQPLVTRLLAWRPLVFVGLISYSLYLWHWPLIVFARHWFPEPLTPTQGALVALATFCIACVSWKFIEQPLRRGGSLWTTPNLRVRYSGVIVCSLAFVGMSLDIGNGFPWLQPKAVLAVVDDEGDRSPLRERCHIARRDQGRLSLADTCVFGSASAREIVVLGDSHGAELGYALADIAREGSLRVRQITASACPPALGFSRDKHQNCSRHTQKMIEELATRPPSTILIVASYFHWAAPGSSREAFLLGIERSAANLRQAGHEVILLGGWPPHPNGRLPDTLGKEVRHGRSAEDFMFPIDQSLAASIDEKLGQIAKRQGAIYLPLLPTICGDSRQCRGMIHGQAILFDRDHLSVSAARHVVRELILPAIGLAETAAGQPTAKQ